MVNREAAVIIAGISDPISLRDRRRSKALKGPSLFVVVGNCCQEGGSRLWRNRPHIEARMNLTYPKPKETMRVKQEDGNGIQLIPRSLEGKYGLHRHASAAGISEEPSEHV